jgi:folate-dependent tRNA-U54 methylase TrmFO/GidA
MRGVGERDDVQQRRSFWLRSFLHVAALMWLCLAISSSAQIEFRGPEHLTGVEGYVASTAGDPVVDAEVTLVRDEKVAFRTRTDKSGEFRFEHVSGAYLFRVERSKYAPAARQIVVRDELVTRLERKRLYVIVGPGACMDECSSVFTSKHEFDRAIREKSKH